LFIFTDLIFPIGFSESERSTTIMQLCPLLSNFFLLLILPLSGGHQICIWIKW
jgi:hypothetical protein